MPCSATVARLALDQLILVRIQTGQFIFQPSAIQCIVGGWNFFIGDAAKGGKMKILKFSIIFVIITIFAIKTVVCLAEEEKSQNTSIDAKKVFLENLKKRQEDYEKNQQESQKALEEYKKQQEESGKMQEEYKKQLGESGRTQEVAKQQAEQYGKLLERSEKQQDKTEEQQKRYDKILSVWEGQQQQYQKYLDGLNKK